MNALTAALATALGGAIGALMRVGAQKSGAFLFGASLPWGTFVVNAVGCLAMGGVAAIPADRFAGCEALRPFLMAGLLGGLTTFSGFAHEAVMLWHRSAALASAYAAATMIVCLSAFVVGHRLGRLLLGTS